MASQTLCLQILFSDVSKQDAVAAVREAFRLGANFFDTSLFYGGTLSEKVLGKALKALDRRRFLIDLIVYETLPALLKLKQAGKIRFIGITGLSLGIFTYVLDRVPPGTVDVILPYCLYGINDSTLEDLLPYLKSKSVEVISAMGLLWRALLVYTVHL